MYYKYFILTYTYNIHMHVFIVYKALWDIHITTSYNTLEIQSYQIFQDKYFLHLTIPTNRFFSNLIDVNTGVEIKDINRKNSNISWDIFMFFFKHITYIKIPHAVLNFEVEIYKRGQLIGFLIPIVPPSTDILTSSSSSAILMKKKLIMKPFMKFSSFSKQILHIITSPKTEMYLPAWVHVLCSVL